MKSEIKVGKSTKVLRPGHAAVKPPAKGGKGKNVKVEKKDSEEEYSDDNFDNDDGPYIHDVDDDPDEPDDNGEFGMVGPFNVEMVPSTSSTVPTNSKKPKPRKSRKIQNVDDDNDMGVFNDLPEVHGSDSEGEMMNNSDPINNRPSFLPVKKEKEDFDFTIFNEKDDILNNLISESSENDAHNIKLEPIYKVELSESHQSLGPMVDPLVSMTCFLSNED